MKALGEFEVWFVIGSQDLYGEETLHQVAENSGKIAAALDVTGGRRAEAAKLLGISRQSLLYEMKKLGIP